MQILEVKNDIAKIIYNPSDNKFLPSDFLLIEDVNQKLIAQIINIETTDKENENLAILRLALSIDKSDNLSYFNGYIPAKNSKLIYITPEEIVELVEGNNKNIYFGNLSNHPSCFVKTNISFINDKLYIQSDRNDKTQIIVKNLVSELKDKDKKIIILDFDGQYSFLENVEKIQVAKQIKLPLNIEAFDTILQYDTIDCPIEDKAVIQSIVLELREYLKTLKDKFIPFNMFKNVVDEEFSSNPVSGLMLLRNKLWLYSQDSLFADKKNQFDIINPLLEKKDIIVIDASSIDEKWHKFIIQTVEDLTEAEAYFILSLNDIEIDKKSIINLYNKQNIIPIVSTNYDSPYRSLLKSLCKNQILSKPQFVVDEQTYYSSLLNRMHVSDFILYGDTTLNLPLVLELQEFNSNTNEDVEQNVIKRDVDKFLSSPQTVIPKTSYSIPEKSSFNDVIIEDDINEENSNLSEKNNDNVLDLDDDFSDVDLDFLDEVDDTSVDDVIDKNVSENVSQEEKKLQDEDEKHIKEITDVIDSLDSLDNIESLDKDENKSNLELENITIPTSDDDILNVPFELAYVRDEEDYLTPQKYDVFEPVQNKNSKPIEKIYANDSDSEMLSKDINQNNIENIEQHDEKVIHEDTTVIEEKEPSSEEAIEMVDVDSLIDDVIKNSQENQKPEESEQNAEDNEDEHTVKDENDTKNNSDDSIEIEFVEDNVNEFKTNIPEPPAINEDVAHTTSHNVPIYETDIPEQEQEEIPFKIGDKVFHPKHGNGVIEGFANYSNKILFCQIDFENVGRRIMDPRVSGLQKVS